MKNAVQPGKVMSVVTATPVVSGKLYQVGNLIGVASGSLSAEDIAEGRDVYELVLNGVFEVPNPDTLTGNQGTAIGYDQANHKVVGAGLGDFDVNLFQPLLAASPAEVILPLGGY